ncbi:cytochrome P450 4d1-like [Uranotaenia lowii]|uniref:cytochrome P450 4d1-like n=1 Tax=Uranotaenia lowii TaxID=190385 RepID=UPI002478FF6E|nr:cytochrome P450 4d1-like [Uranotaenia lowii]
MLALLLLCPVLLGLFWWKIHIQRRQFLTAFAPIPGPRGLPLLGNAPEVARLDTTELLEKMFIWTSTYGARTKFDLFTKFWIMHASPEDIEKIATDANFNRKSNDYDVLQEWLGNGILLDHGQSWFVNRRALTPAFHFKILETFIPTMQDQAMVLVQKLLASGGRPVDIFPAMKLYALDVLLETAMGVRIGVQQNDSEYVRAVAGLSHITFWRMTNFMGYAEWTFRWTKHYKPYQEMLKVSDDFTMGIILKRRAELVDGVIEEVDENENEMKKRIPLLDKLLQLEVEGRRLTNEEIRAQVNTFMFAGHDTTSSALTFIVFLLAKHPEIQKKVYDEIVSVIGSSKSIPPLTTAMLNELKYMDLAIKEALRIYPTVPFMSRTIDADQEVAGVTYPKGTIISLGVIFMQRNPKYFPQPTRFIPERFSMETDAEKRNPYTYIPFSAGSRNCIGQKFAMNKIKVLLIYVLTFCRAELEDPDFEPRLKAELILKPVDGMPVRFLPR